MIEAHKLTRKFGSLTAVDNLDLEVEKGEVLGFLGPNGAGKTTTIRMLAGMIAPTSGYAIVAGKRTDGPVEELHEVIGLLTESPGFYERLSAARNLEYYAGFYRLADPAKNIEKYLKLMGLWERRADPVGAFSKGMKQRLALIRAMVHEPPVLFLDEPTAGLDPENAEEVRSLIKKLSGEGRTVFLSTHNLAEAEELCRRIAIFRRGLLALDTPGKLREHLFRRKVIIRLVKIDAKILETLENLPFIKSLDPEGDRISFELTEPEKDTPALVEAVTKAGGKIIEVTEAKHSLEDIYFSLVREEHDR